MRKTQNAIKHVLTERYYAWEDAVELAKSDPTLEFTEKGVKYHKPRGTDRDEDAQWEDIDGDANEDTAVAESGDKATAAEGKPGQEKVDPSLPQDGGKGQQEVPRV